MERRLEVFLVHDFRVLKKEKIERTKYGWANGKAEMGKSCSPVRLRPLRQLRVVPIQPRRQRKEEKPARPAAVPPLEHLWLVCLPHTARLPPPAASFSLLGKVIGEQELHLQQQQQPPAPSLRAPHRTAPRKGAETPRAPGQTEAVPSAPSAAGEREEVEGGGERERRPSPPPYLSGHSGLSSPALMREQVPAAAALSDRAAPAAPARWGLGRRRPLRSAALPSLLSSPLQATGWGCEVDAQARVAGEIPTDPGRPRRSPPGPLWPCGARLGHRAGRESRAGQDRAAAPGKGGRGCRSRGRRDAAAPAAAKNWTVSPSRGRRETRTAAPAAGEPRTRPGPASLGGGVANLVSVPALQR